MGVVWPDLETFTVNLAAAFQAELSEVDRQNVWYTRQVMRTLTVVQSGKYELLNADMSILVTSTVTDQWN